MRIPKRVSKRERKRQRNAVIQKVESTKQLKQLITSAEIERAAFNWFVGYGGNVDAIIEKLNSVISGCKDRLKKFKGTGLFFVNQKIMLSNFKSIENFWREFIFKLKKDPELVRKFFARHIKSYIRNRGRKTGSEDPKIDVGAFLLSEPSEQQLRDHMSNMIDDTAEMRVFLDVARKFNIQIYGRERAILEKEIQHQKTVIKLLGRVPKMVITEKTRLMELARKDLELPL